MPVARIVTRFAEETAPLIARLRARGYTIEIVDPGSFRVTPADLEIALDRMTTPEALHGAARFARERDAEVFVAAGMPLDEEAGRALREGAVVRRNAIAESFKKLITPFRRLGAEVHESRKARRQQKIDLELAREAERKQKAERKAAERAEDDRRRAEREGALARQREEEVRLAADREAQAAERRRLEDAERQRREAEVARLAAEEAERRRVAEEVARAERERRSEEERQRAVAGAAALVEARRREAEMRRLAAGAPASRRQRPVPAALIQERAASRAMKRGMVAAACVAVLVAIGWGAYQNRTPAQPLSNQQRVRGSDIQQDVPFGAATIKPRPAAKPQPQPKTAQQKPAPASAPKPSPKRTQRYAADDVDMVAEDEIVYHGAPKNSKSRASAQTPAQQQQDGVKRISDLDEEDQ